jgi:hypothetical protein
MGKLELEPKEESEIDDSEKDEFETMMESGIDETKLFGVEKAYEEGEKLAEKVEGRLPRKQTIMETRIDDTYNFTYDASIDDNTQFAEFDSDLFDVTQVFAGDSDDVKTCQFCIPELDAIADVRRRILGTPEKPKYYESAVVYDSKNEVQAVIILTDQVGLALAADDNIVEGSNGPEPMSYRDLTFKSSGSSLMLPFIFSRINFAPNTLRGECRGKMVLYDPDPAVSSEEEGDRHAVIGKVVEGIPCPATTAQGSSSDAAPTQPGTPAPLTESEQSALRIKSKIHLINNLGVKSDILKEDARKYLYKAMLYHIDDDDREKMTDQAKPRVSSDPALPDALPTELADTLDQDLKDWLKKTYSVAYICKNLSRQNKRNQEEIKAVFTDDDMDRLEYYWYGKGPSCLNRSTEYSRLNSFCTMISFRRRVPAIMTYILDGERSDVIDENGNTITGLNGGTKWAYLYYHQVSREDYVDQTSLQSKYTDLTVISLPHDSRKQAANSLESQSIGVPLHCAASPLGGTTWRRNGWRWACKIACGHGESTS